MIEEINNKKEGSEHSEDNEKSEPIHRDFSIYTLNRKLFDISKKRVSRTPDKKDNDIIHINTAKLIHNTLDDIQIRIIGHSRTSKIYENRDKIFSYPVTLLSSSTVSTILMSISVSGPGVIIIKYISLSLAIMAFLFSITRDYLKFSHIAQSHNMSSKLYTTLLRTIEMRLIKNNSVEEQKNIFQDLIEQVSIIETYEISIPYEIDTDIRNNYALMHV
jgi:hypothetical protein